MTPYEMIFNQIELIFGGFPQIEALEGLSFLFTLIYTLIFVLMPLVAFKEVFTLFGNGEEKPKRKKRYFRD